MKRAATAAAHPALGGALSDGKITAEHVDSFGRAERDLTASERERFASHAARLALVGQHGSFEDFEHELKKTVVLVREDDGTERLQRQKRSVRLRTWTDKVDGMFCVFGRFDPVTGLRFDQQLADAIERNSQSGYLTIAQRSRERNKTSSAPTHCSVCQMARAAAWGGPEFIAVVDERTPGPDGEPVVDFGQSVDIPKSVIDQIRQRAHNYRVVVRDGVVVSAPGVLDLGRTTRLANRAQRRALRALYPTCAIPGCGVRYSCTKVHHVIWWEHHGLTNLENLLPLCERHHQKVHLHGWQLILTGNRHLTIHLPDGTTMTTGPPQRHAA